MLTLPSPKSLRCAGYVLQGVLFVAAGAAGIALAVLALLWLPAATASLFGLPKNTGPLFYLGYVVLITGGAVGAVMCQDARS